MTMLKEHKIEKKYYRLGEVVRMLRIKHATVRFYSNHLLKHLKRSKTQDIRLFTQDDVEDLREMIRLLRTGRYTIKGAIHQMQEDTIDRKEMENALRVLC